MRCGLSFKSKCLVAGTTVILCCFTSANVQSGEDAVDQSLTQSIDAMYDVVAALQKVLEKYRESAKKEQKSTAGKQEVKGPGTIGGRWGAGACVVHYVKYGRTHSVCFDGFYMGNCPSLARHLNGQWQFFKGAICPKKK